EARVVARPFPNRKRVAGAIGDLGQARPWVHVEDSAASRGDLGGPAQRGIGPLAEQVVAGGGVGQRATGEGDQELQVDVPLAAVAGAEVDLHLGLYQIAVGRVVPDPT